MKIYKKNYGGEVEEVLNMDGGELDLSSTAAGGVIRRYNTNKKSNEILLIQRSKDSRWQLQWEIPRGKCDKEAKYTKGKLNNLSIAQLILIGLKREIKEETGLDVRAIKLIEKFGYLFPDGIKIQYIFLCKMDDPKQNVQISFEHNDYKWISSLNEAKSLNVPEELITILSKIF